MSDNPHSPTTGTVTPPHDLSAGPHRAPTGAGVKALRPLRGRATREPRPRRLRRHAHELAKTPRTRSRTTLDRPRSFRDDTSEPAYARGRKRTQLPMVGCCA